MDILSLISSSTNNQFKKKASTNGGEYSGSCPWCGGNDRFSIHPTKNHYVCRQCKKAGDSIRFLMDYEHKTYPQACVALNIPFEHRNVKFSSESNSVQQHQWKPRPDYMPDTVWQGKASVYLFQCFKYLMSPDGRIHRDWLNNRGISNDTIKTARLGWNSKSVSFDRESWGLQTEENESGRQKQIWIPEGLVIPCFKNGQLLRLRIRQSNPKASAIDRFLMVAGSSMDYLDYSQADSSGLTADTARADTKAAAMVVESELDGWLLHSQASKAEVSLNILSIGNSTSRPNESAHKILSSSKVVHICLDNDDAGKTETIWWRNQYQPHTKISQIPKELGKDPGEAFTAGFDFTAWFEGLKIQQKQQQNKKTIEQVKEETKDIIELSAKVSQQHDPQEIPIVFVPLRECFHRKRCSSLIADVAKCQSVCSKAGRKSVFELKNCPEDNWFRPNYEYEELEMQKY